ncbi:MAG: xylulokinase [Oscillospiraceae bacterium]
MSVILGIDLGTSSVKAMLLDCQTGGVTVESSAYNVCIERDGYAEQDPETWWLGTKEALRKLKKEHDMEFSQIAAVGISGQMHGIVLMGEDGAPLRPAILWLDQRAKEQLKQINENIDFDKMGSLFRSRVFTGFAFPSLLWVKENEAETLKRTKAFIMPKDYIRFKITGLLGSDMTDASATTLFDTAKRKWAFDIINEFELPEDIFPLCGESMDLAGYVTSKCETECGLKAGIPVIFGCGDQMAQSIGNGVCKEGEVISNIGTGGQISAYIRQAKYDKALRTHTFCNAFDKAYTIFGATLCGGMSLNWLKNKVLGIDGFDEMSKMAGEIPPGSGGIVFLPYLSGERTPHMNPNAKGLFYGLGLSHDKRYLSRAVMEGVTFSLKDSLTIFDEMGIEYKNIIASGGGARSNEWLQIQADVFNRNVRVCVMEEQACLGACILAGVGSGILESVSSAANYFVKFREEIFTPNSENVKIYEEQYELFRNLYAVNKNFMK